MHRERLDGWCERGILGGVLAILVFGALATGGVRPQDFVIIQWLTLGVMFLWALRFWLNPSHRLLWPPICWAVVLFLGYAIVRYLTADIEFVARQELIKVLIYGCLFFIILNNLHRLESTQMIALTLLFLAMGISLYALSQLLTGSEQVWHFKRPPEYRGRGSGTFICPDHLAGFLGMLLPLGLTYTLTGRFKNVTKVLVGYASLVIFTGIVVTVSWGGWIATGASLAVLFFWLLRKRDYRLQSLFLLAALIGIVVVFFVQSKLSHTATKRIGVSRPEDGVRVKLWAPAVAIWQDHFWCGAGPAHFDYRFRQYRPPDEQLQVRPDRVHNDYLNTLADWGIIGAILVASAWGLFYWEVFRSWKYVQRAQNDLTSKRSNKSSFVLGSALGLLAALVQSIFDFNMHIPANAVLAVTLLALASGHSRFATDAYWITPRWPLRSLVTLVLVGGLFYVSAQTWRKTEECRWLARAKRLKNYSSEQVAALQKAAQIEGKNFETAYNIGEGLRRQSWQGNTGYKDQAKEAMKWFEQSMELNRYDPYGFVRYGMCLHWVDRKSEAETYFKRAAVLDPNGYYTLAHVGWHYVQLEDYASAKNWFERSLQLRRADNPIARSYLDLVNQRLAPPAVSPQTP